jgi:hypothetical protein
MAVTYSVPFMIKPESGFRLGDIRSIWDAIASANGASTAYGIAAAGTTIANGTQLTSVFNQVDTGTSNQGLNLPNSKGLRSTPYNQCIVWNNTANTLIVYAFNVSSGTADTINGVAGATGISLPAATLATFYSMKPGVWASDQGTADVFGAITTTSITNSGNFTESTAGSGFVQKTGAGNARAGSFSLNGATAVTVTNTTVAITDFIGLSLNTIGGSVGVQPHVTTISAGVYFTVVGTAADTSLYNYTLIGVN